MMWWLLLLIPLGIVVLFLFLISPRWIGRPDMSRLRVDFAHRGLHDEEIPENSLPAFARAVEEGFGIELDVQLSSDGVIMVFHDDTLARMTGAKGKLNEYTREELQQLRLSESEETVPTLDQVLETVGGRVPLLIELKGESAGGDGALCEKLAERLETYGGAYCVESFNPMILSWFKRNCPHIARGQLVTNTLKERPKGNKILNFLLAHLMLNVVSRPDFVAYNEKYDREFALRLNIGLFRAPSFVWTVRDMNTWGVFREAGSPSIFEGFLPPKQSNQGE
ncbi:MAG: glycerophosphodiester phosphodiesterase [Clostridia bacterium]|nr:glycerophosphodiester phosphodiesterase [Clostridia bacterium]